MRGHCVYASALLYEEINNIRPKDMQIIIPQIDARLWTQCHTTWWPAIRPGPNVLIPPTDEWIESRLATPSQCDINSTCFRMPHECDGSQS